MAIRVVLVDYYKVMVGDRPGEGVRVLSALSSAGINLRAVHAFPAGNGRTQLDLVPVSFRRFETAARRARIRHGQRKKAIMVAGDDSRGVVARLLGRLADARVNVTAVTALRGGEGRFGGIVWVKPRDVQTALAALRTR